MFFCYSSIRIHVLGMKFWPHLVFLPFLYFFNTNSIQFGLLEEILLICCYNWLAYNASAKMVDDNLFKKILEAKKVFFLSFCFMLPNKHFGWKDCLQSIVRSCTFWYTSLDLKKKKQTRYQTRPFFSFSFVFFTLSILTLFCFSPLKVEAIRNLFAALFLASIGMLIHVQFLWNHVDILLAAVILVIIIKTIVVTIVVKAFRYSIRTAFVVSITNNIYFHCAAKSFILIIGIFYSAV